MSCLLFAAGVPARGEAPVVSAGKQLAARSGVEWDAHDIDHPVLGPIKYAVQRTAVATPAGNGKILSLAFVSCQKASGRIAIELTNASGSDLAGGLAPMETPRLVCNGPRPGARAGMAKSDIAAKWEISPLGDTLARGLSPADLRRCASIDVLQSVAPPPGSAEKSQRIAMEITPYGEALDSVFAACGEKTAYAPAQPVTPAAQPAPAPASAPRVDSTEAPWKPARTAAVRRTNVRAAGSLGSAIVVKLAPGTKLLAQKTSTAWWKVRPRSGAGFQGYIRQDRLVFE
jgi:hypothetical protein